MFGVGFLSIKDVLNLKGSYVKLEKGRGRSEFGGLLGVICMPFGSLSTFAIFFIALFRLAILIHPYLFARPSERILVGSIGCLGVSILVLPPVDKTPFLKSFNGGRKEGWGVFMLMALEDYDGLVEATLNFS